MSVGVLIALMGSTTSPSPPTKVCLPVSMVSFAIAQSQTGLQEKEVLGSCARGSSSMCLRIAHKKTLVLGPCLSGAAGGGCSTGDGKPGDKGDSRAVSSSGLVPALPSSLLYSCMAVQPPSCPPTRAATQPLAEMLASSSGPQTLGLRLKRMQNHSIFTCKREAYFICRDT